MIIEVLALNKFRVIAHSICRGFSGAGTAASSMTKKQSIAQFKMRRNMCQSHNFSFACEECGSRTQHGLTPALNTVMAHVKDG